MPDVARGRRIRQLREALGMTQSEMHLAIGGVGRAATVGAWESGESHPPKGTLRLLSDLASDSEAVFHWLEQGGQAPEISRAPRANGEAQAGRPSLGQEIRSLTEPENERDVRIAGVVARLLAGAVNKALLSSPARGEQWREVTADAIHAFALRLCAGQLDITSLLAVEELLRKGNL